MNSPEFRLIGRGVYSVAESARLTGVTAEQIRRWSRGYTWTYLDRKHYSPAIVGTGASENEEPILTFQDLVEIRFLNAFRREGVSWRVIRIAASRAMELLKKRNPFATRIFRTDGRTILLDLANSSDLPTDRKLLELIHDQLEWDQFVRPCLRKEAIDFNNDDEPQRWWPMGRSRDVVVDPRRSFGAPIVHSGGVQTFVLARAVAVEGSAELVADWYEIPVGAVRDAIAFESTLRAAA